MQSHPKLADKYDFVIRINKSPATLNIYYGNTL